LRKPGYPMKVLFLTHRLPFAPNRGDRIRAYHILQHLSRFASVDLLSLVHDSEEAAQLGGLPVKRVTIVRTTPWRNRVRSALRLGTSQPLTHTLLDSPGLTAAVQAAVRSIRPDVILAYCTGMARLALEEPLKNIPLVLDMVDVDSAKWQALSRTTPPPLGWIYGREARCLGRFEAEVVAQARTTLVVNGRERATLAMASPRADVRIVPNGIDFEQFRPANGPASEARVVFCGVLNYRPNEEAALRLVQGIWPKVRAERPDARLLIVGAHPTAKLRQAAQGDPSIEVTGAVPDVRPYLWSAAVSIAPLLTARGLQNKVLEALAAGLPVVTTPAVADGLPATAMSGCIVANDDQESADAVLSLLRRTPTERRAFARHADLSELGWARQLAGLVPILTAAAQRKPFIRLAS
jgi:sugar transferase (PEP-CTERM/EpsH1 system associated)